MIDCNLMSAIAEEIRETERDKHSKKAEEYRKNKEIVQLRERIERLEKMVNGLEIQINNINYVVDLERVLGRGIK